MTRPWEADPNVTFRRRVGKSPLELGNTSANPSCPDIWELSNGDFAVIGRDLTDTLSAMLPDELSIGHDERLVVIPRSQLVAARSDIPLA